MVPISTTGHSARPDDFGQQPLVRDHFQPMDKGRLLDAFEDDRRALLGIQHDMGLVQLLAA